MPNRISNIGSKLTLNFWLLGGWTIKIKVCLKLKLKNAKTSFKWFFWNFEISVKKSADFSCLFTFFQKYCKFMIISSTFWELHNCQLKLAICLHWFDWAFYNIFKNFVNKKFLYLSLEYTLNSAGHSENFDFFGTLSIC